MQAFSWFLHGHSNNACNATKTVSYISVKDINHHIQTSHLPWVTDDRTNGWTSASVLAIYSVLALQARFMLVAPAWKLTEWKWPLLSRKPDSSTRLKNHQRSVQQLCHRLKFYVQCAVMWFRYGWQTHPISRIILTVPVLPNIDVTAQTGKSEVRLGRRSRTKSYPGLQTTHSRPTGSSKKGKGIPFLSSIDCLALCRFFLMRDVWYFQRVVGRDPGVNGMMTWFHTTGTFH